MHDKITLNKVLRYLFFGVLVYLGFLGGPTFLEFLSVFINEFRSLSISILDIQFIGLAIYLFGGLYCGIVGLWLGFKTIEFFNPYAFTDNDKEVKTNA